MSKANTYSSTGTKATAVVSLPKEVFAEEVKNHKLLQEAYRAYLAEGRVRSAKTLTRGEVRGGGKKPWKQKGTGRARVGSIRSPIWRGGGITFGPTGNENHTLKLSLKAKRKAIRQALTLKASDGQIKIIDDFKVKDGKTKAAASLLTKLGTARRILVVVETKTPDVTRATNNLPGVELVSAKYLNVFKVLNADHIIITKSALVVVKDWLGSK